MLYRLCLVVMCFASCAKTKLLGEARKSAYDDSFARVYTAVLAETEKLYPHLRKEDPRSGVIITMRHPVRIKTGTNIHSSTDYNQTQDPRGNPFSVTRADQNAFFIGMEIRVHGGRPWIVDVKGRAFKWSVGDSLPQEMRGGDEPHWLKGRVEALQIAIHKRLRKTMVARPTFARPDHSAVNPVKNVEPIAAKRLTELKEVLSVRDYGQLKLFVADPVEWGGVGTLPASTAIAAWQADSSILDGVLRSLENCSQKGDEILCSGSGNISVYKRELDWRLSRFAKE